MYRLKKPSVMIVCVAAIAALLLHGCGESGGSTPDPSSQGDCTYYELQPVVNRTRPCDSTKGSEQLHIEQDLNITYYSEHGSGKPIGLKVQDKAGKTWSQQGGPPNPHGDPVTYFTVNLATGAEEKACLLITQMSPADGNIIALHGQFGTGASPGWYCPNEDCTEWALGTVFNQWSNKVMKSEVRSCPSAQIPVTV
eukprot:TRINITY_DN125360_c0_g1_i1.p1 TRINITY_DN125360_c0_g1~~TRINITY_DN125360_c0_g1_i1.p1  ORF type:complete len:196 (+),score=38.26 TRINITY_DN125360_c0_g1_i1:92-679(+)